MAKKTTPLEKAARMLDLVPFISSHQGIGTSELAAEFGIPVDELLSDLNSLWMCGDNRFDLIDLQFDSGYVTIRNAETLNLTRSLSQQEIISILIGLDLIEKNLPRERADVIEEIAVLRAKLGESNSRILDASPAENGEILAILKNALASQRKIDISYFSPIEDEISDRTVTPLSLTVSEDGRQYLLAFCERAQGERTFRVDRIRSASILEAKAEDKTVDKAASNLIPATVKIARQLRRSRESLGDFVEGDGSVVTVSTYNPEWLSRTVISAGGAMEVTSSPEIRSRIVEIATMTLEEYR
jgi:proteasome accessory factor C